MTGLTSMRLLSAFQSLSITGPKPDGLNMTNAYGCTNAQASKIIEQITSIDPRQGKNKKVAPPKKATDLQNYMSWLFRRHPQG